MTLQELKRRLRIPVIGSPLFIISNPDLVIAQCKAGIVGSFPALNARPAEVLDQWLERITTELAEYDRLHPERPSAPFAVNQIVHKSNDRLEHDVAMCVKWKVPVIITSLGARTDVFDAIHSYGGMVLHDVIDQKFAHKAIEKGADGLILVATGAGGHAGVQSPFALVQETREWFDGPIALSGSIATGDAVLAAQAMGHFGGQIRFVRIDGSKNEIDHPAVRLRGFPSVFFFRASDKLNPIEYYGDRTVAGFLAFIRNFKGGNNKGEGAEAEVGADGRTTRE